MNDDFMPGFPGADIPAGAPAGRAYARRLHDFQALRRGHPPPRDEQPQAPGLRPHAGQAPRRAEEQLQQLRGRHAARLSAPPPGDGRREEVQHGPANAAAGDSPGPAAHRRSRSRRWRTPRRSSAGSRRSRSSRARSRHACAAGIQDFEAGPARRTTPPCTSASAASASRAWGRCSSPSTVKKGYASQQPEFVLRRPKVIVSE